MDKGRPALLLVDRSVSYLLSMGTLFRKLNYTVRSSMTAPDALKTMATHQHSLVLTDTALPGMSGVDLLIQMKQDPRLLATPVIIHTSETDPSIERTCMLAGCAAFLKKPAEPNALHRAIQTAIKDTPRHHIRIDTFLPAEIEGGPDAGGNAGTCRVTTLSENGVFVRTHTPAPANTLLSLTMAVGNRKIKVKAVVLYNSTQLEGRQQVPGMGMKFMEISQDDRAAVRDYIKELIAKEMSFQSDAS
jgi:CheY-like chemotaxis protein